MTPHAGDEPATWKLTEDKYGELPFVLLSNGYHPFEAWRRPGSAVPPRLEQLWKGTATIYQLFTFHTVTAATWGEAFADRILGLQVRQLNGIEPGLGDQHAAGIHRIADLASQPKAYRDAAGQSREAPLPWRVAIDFLGTCPESPYCADPCPGSGGELPNFPDQVDTALAADLEYAAAQAADHFQALVRNLSILPGGPND